MVFGGDGRKVSSTSRVPRSRALRVVAGFTQKKKPDALGFQESAVELKIEPCRTQSTPTTPSTQMIGACNNAFLARKRSCLGTWTLNWENSVHNPKP